MENSRSQIKKGLIVCNIGMGKGKTTAAMGVAARAAGSGLDVFILQFVKAKSGDDSDNNDDDLSDEALAKLDDRKTKGEWPVSNEVRFFNEVQREKTDPPAGGSKQKTDKKPLGRIDTEICGLGFVGILGDEKDKDAHVQAARQGLIRAKEIMLSGKHQLLVLDELLSAIEVSLISEDEVVELLQSKPLELHLVITGHNKFPKILALCDTVTEMKMIKHAYYDGVLAQSGIDY